MMKILSPTAILGYGFPLSSFQRGLEENPDIIGVDAGSVDPGPYYLGEGKSFTDRTAVKRDLTLMLKEGTARNIPILIGTAGGAGARPHVDWCKEIIDEIAKEQRLSFRMGIIYADIPPETVKTAIKEGRTSPLDDLAPLSETMVDESCAMVAQMGTAPFIDALEQGCDVVLAGRAYDPAVFAAFPVMNGFDPGLAIHLGKILECAAIAADPGSGSDCVLGVLDEESFVLQPLSSERTFTAASTASHSLYEKSDPYLLPGPDGILDLTNVSFQEKEGGKVEVKGSTLITGKKTSVKVEGVREAGYRTISIAGVRDPIMVHTIDSIIDHLQKVIADFCRDNNFEGTVFFHLYGKNGVMGLLEPEKESDPKEIGILIEAIGRNQKEADALCSFSRSTLLHYGYPGRIATAGNVAFPFSPSDISAGKVYEFSIYHLVEVKDEVFFPLHIIQVGGEKW